MLIEESLRSRKIPYQMKHCETVNVAVRKIRAYQPGDADIPDLLIVDYNLPAGEAREVIEAAVTNPALARTRRAVITSSLSPRDREDALQHGAECFISKPADLDLFLNEVGDTLVRLLAQD